MHQYDVWLDLECTVDGAIATICTLFARREFAVRPLDGESITFWPKKDSARDFQVVTSLGTESHHYVATQLDQLAHHFHPGDDQMLSTTCLHLRALRLASMSDVRLVVALLIDQHGFELDPYGINRLDDSSHVA